jgi:RNA polymerase sigma-B factor
VAPFPAPSLTTRADHAHDTDLHVEELALRLADTDDAERCRELRDAIVELTLPLADAIAMRYTGRGIETDDLVQVARTALVKAAVRYRPGAGPGFAAFAAPTVSGEIKRWFRDQGWSVRPPRRIQELRSRLVVEEERLRHDLGRDPHDDELATALEVPVADVVEARSCSAGYHAVSLDAPSPAGTSLADHLLVSACPTTTYDTRDALRRSVAALTDRQRLVLQLRFVDELTQSEIGERIGVSQMQVSRILRGILDQLRCELLDGRVQETSAA